MCVTARQMSVWGGGVKKGQGGDCTARYKNTFNQTGRLGQANKGGRNVLTGTAAAATKSCPSASATQTSAPHSSGPSIIGPSSIPHTDPSPSFIWPLHHPSDSGPSFVLPLSCTAGSIQPSTHPFPPFTPPTPAMHSFRPSFILPLICTAGFSPASIPPLHRRLPHPACPAHRCLGDVRQRRNKLGDLQLRPAFHLREDVHGVREATYGAVPLIPSLFFNTNPHTNHSYKSGLYPAEWN